MSGIAGEGQETLQRRQLIRGAGALVLGAGLSAPAIVRAQDQVIKVGSMSPLTGSQAAYGTFITQGQRLFEETFNKAGGFKAGPEKGKLLKMIYEDDGEGTGTPDLALSAFRKLVQIDNVKAISGIVLSSVALPLAPIAERAKCVVIAIDPTTPRLSEFPNFYRITESSDSAGPTYAGCVHKAGFKKVNFLWVNDPAGAGFHDKFVPAFKEMGGTIVHDLPISVGSPDFRTEITKCMTSDAECNVLLAHQGDILIILKQARDLGYVAPRTNWFSSFYSEEMLQKGGSIFEGSYAKQYHIPRETAVYQEFEKNFKAKHGDATQISYFSLAAYDALTAITKAIEIGGYDWDGMNAALHGMEFQGVAKRNKFAMKNGDNITTSQDVSKVVNGKYVVQFNYDPSAV